MGKGEGEGEGGGIDVRIARVDWIGLGRVKVKKGKERGVGSWGREGV